VPEGRPALTYRPGGGSQLAATLFDRGGAQRVIVGAITPPARIVPALADEGIYIASESSFHRVLRAHGQMHLAIASAPGKQK
jgi:hypothetical protein